MGLSHRTIREVIVGANRLATKKVPLTPNAVSSMTEINSGDNVGDLFPLMYIEETGEQTLTVDLMLKGGLSENLGQLYSGLVDKKGDRLLFDASKSSLSPFLSQVSVPNLEVAVTRCVLDAVSRAHGKGCRVPGSGSPVPAFPYTIAVAIGGARDQVTYMSKRQLMRRLHDVHTDPAVAAMETSVLNKVKNLAGQSSVLGVKIAAAHRHPESYFIDVSFACWAHRRGRLIW
jgi:fumarate hydratase class I